MVSERSDGKNGNHRNWVSLPGRFQPTVTSQTIQIGGPRSPICEAYARCP